MHRIIWIPFAGQEATEFLERSNNWLQERPDKNFQIVTYNPQRNAMGLGSHPALLNLINGSQIYMRGHGLPGNPHVTTTVNGTSVRLHITESIDRLIEMGLSTNYRGTIKFYSCFSALKGKPKYQDGGTLVFDKNHPTDVLYTKIKGGTFSTGPFHPLAKVGARYFRQLGFSHCKYLGYKGPLTGTYVDGGDPDNLNHKYCEVVKFDAFGDHHFQPLKNRRASDARKSF